jgi:bifunctional non-homologous end joining protein LigD
VARPSNLPKPLRSMLATLIDAPFGSAEWVYGTKWDGFRLLARFEKGSVTLQAPTHPYA